MSTKKLNKRKNMENEEEIDDKPKRIRFTKKSSPACNYGKKSEWKKKSKKRDLLLRKLDQFKTKEKNQEEKKEMILMRAFEREGIQGVIQMSELKKNRSLFLGCGDAKYLYNVSPYVLEKLELLVQMSLDQMDPFLNGKASIKDKICVEVDDQKMGSFVEAFTDSGVWEYLEQNTIFGYSNSERKVAVHKWRSKNLKDVENFLTMFTRISQNELIERHFIHQSDSLKNATQLNKYLVNNARSLAFSELAEFYEIPGRDHTISSCEMVLGEHRDSHKEGYFTIEYLENVYPKIGKGLLRFSFRYFNYVNGVKIGY